MGRREIGADMLRARLLTSLGLSLVVQPACGPFANCRDHYYTATLNLDELRDTGDTADSGDSGAAPLEACPTDPGEIRALFQADGGYCSVATAHLIGEAGSACTYEYACMTCCGYGRPYLDERGSPVESGTRPARDWVRAGTVRTFAALSAAERRAVGEYWLANARAEHSSVAGFHRFALDLLAHGAPPRLVERAQRAAMQELGHAVDAFTLASAYLEEPFGPEPMPLGASAPIARSIAELAAWTVRDGAIGETIAAHLAALALSETTDPEVRAVLERVVREETEHAELAWGTLAWALDTGDDSVREAIARAFSVPRHPVSATVGWTEAQRAHGVAAPAVEVERARDAFERIVLPVAHALLCAHGWGR
jgi:hypothetical protein